MRIVEGINSDIELTKEDNFIILSINDEDIILGKDQALNLIDVLNKMVVD